MINRKRINRMVLFVLLIFPFIKPQIFDTNAVTTYLYYILKTISSICIVYLYSRKFKFREISSAIYLVILFRAISIIPTLTNPYGDIVKYLGISLFDITFVMIMQWCCATDKKLFLISAIRILEFWIIINAFSLFVPAFHMEGIDITGTIRYSSLLGGDNRYIYYYLPMLFLKIIYVNEYKMKITIGDYIWYLICLSTVAYTKSMGALVGILLFIPFMYYIKSDKEFKVINYNLILIGMLALNILFVIYRIQEFFSYFILNVLHKDLTISFRTLIWDQVLAAIKDKPLLGYGYETAKGIAMHCHGGNHPHNYMLTLLLRGGFLGFISYCFILLYANIGLRDNRHDRNYKTFSFVMGVSLLLCIFDSFDYVFFYLIVFAPAFIFKKK